MKITFVGTSHGVPSAERYCSCYMIEVGKKIYFVDAGAPVAEMIIRYGGDINDFSALFTTHIHGDHTLGVIGLVNLMNWYYKFSSGDFYITTQEQIDSIINWINAAGDKFENSGRLRLNLAKAGIVFEDENIKVEYIPNEHMSNSYSILITEGEKRVLFGGDFSHGMRKHDIPQITKEPLDLFVCEMAHFVAADIAPYLDSFGVKKLAFTHVFPLSKYDEIEEMKGKYSFDILTPDDGFVLEI